MKFDQDSLGSTSHTANASGQLVEWYRYDLYGKPKYFSASNSQLPSSNFNVRDLHGGARWMPELGLYDDRNRFMSPELGRFLQPDPIGFKGDASNLYRYCGNDWANRTDPMGLEGGVTAMVSDLARWAAKIEREKPDSRKDFAHMPLDQYRFALERGAIATARINNDIAQHNTVTTGQGGSGGASTANRSAYPPAIAPSTFQAMKSATDKSAAAMAKDPENYPYTVTSGTGGQSEPKRGIRYEAAGHEYFREKVAVRGDLQSVGHVHNSGAGGFSPPDRSLNVPIMKNRDGYMDNHGHIKQYDLYHQGWRWYLRPDMSIESGPMRY